MSDYVWVNTTPSLFETHFGFGWAKEGFSPQELADAYNALILDSEKGIPLPQSRFPQVLETHFTPTPGDPHKYKLPAKLPHFFNWTCPVISKEIADVLRQFDIGATNLYPVAMRRADKGTTFDQEFFILNVGVPKDTLVPEQSPGASAAGSKTNRYYQLSVYEDDQLTVKGTASYGSDFWVDPVISGGQFFVSDRLYAALSKAGLAAPLMFRRCRVI